MALLCRRRPYAVILFDEVEKAHADVFNILLQILDDGRVTDSQGRMVSFKNAILIMTSNMGSQYIVEGMQKDPDGVKELVMSQVEFTLSCCCAANVLQMIHMIGVFQKLQPYF